MPSLYFYFTVIGPPLNATNSAERRENGITLLAETLEQQLKTLRSLFQATFQTVRIKFAIENTHGGGRLHS